MNDRETLAEELRRIGQDLLRAAGRLDQGHGDLVPRAQLSRALEELAKERANNNTLREMLAKANEELRRARRQLKESGRDAAGSRRRAGDTVQGAGP